MIDDPPTILRIRLPGRPGRLWLCDSRNWGVEPPPGVVDVRAEALWLADVMRRMVDGLVSRGWGGLKTTAGSQSLATWRRKYLTHSVVAHATPDVLELEEAGYYGGRCECGRLGLVDGPLYYLDRRSAYAHACATLDVPCKIERVFHGDLRLSDLDSKSALSTLAEVEIDALEPAYPSGSSGGVTFPVGRIKTVLAGPELADAVSARRVRRLLTAVRYSCRPALSAYALALWAARQDYAAAGDEALEGWVKKLLVGLPGKLGQRVASWEAAPEVPPEGQWATWWHYSLDRQMTRLRSLGGSVQRQGRRGWTYDALPAVAAWVLSCARLALLAGIRAAGWSECVYWDTDSLLLTQAGWDRFRRVKGLVGCGLGQWRLVQTVQAAAIKGVKHYVFDDVTKCAGMPKSDTEATSLASRYWYRETFGIALNERHAPGAARTLRSYSRPPSYALGRVGDGGRVYPFVRDDWGE